MTLREAFELFASKGPVNHPGPQRKADAAWWLVKPHLTTQERNHLGTARGHALDVREGRREFDRVMGTIRARLFRTP